MMPSAARARALTAPSCIMPTSHEGAARPLATDAARSPYTAHLPRRGHRTPSCESAWSLLSSASLRLNCGERLAGLRAESLDVSNAWRVTTCQHPGLELLGSRATIASHYSGGHRLHRNMQVLARGSAVRAQGDVGLLRLAERLDDTGGVAQQGAQLGRGLSARSARATMWSMGPRTRVPRFIASRRSWNWARAGRRRPRAGFLRTAWRCSHASDALTTTSMSHAGTHNGEEARKR